MQEKYKKGEIAMMILKTLAVGGLAVAVLALPGLAQVLTLFKPKNTYERSKVVRAYRNLEKRKYINVYRKNGKDVVEITEQGRKKILQYDYENLKLKKQKKWDGMWRVVIFDIPEKKKYARRALSAKLNNIGFHKLQKSVFIYPYKCIDEVEFIANYFKVRNCLKCLLVKDLEDSKKLKNIFSIR